MQRPRRPCSAFPDPRSALLSSRLVGPPGDRPCATFIDRKSFPRDGMGVGEWVGEKWVSEGMMWIGEAEIFEG